MFGSLGFWLVLVLIYLFWVLWIMVLVFGCFCLWLFVILHISAVWIFVLLVYCGCFGFWLDVGLISLLDVVCLV